MSGETALSIGSIIGRNEQPMPRSFQTIDTRLVLGGGAAAALPSCSNSIYSQWKLHCIKWGGAVATWQPGTTSTTTLLLPLLAERWNIRSCRRRSWWVEKKVVGGGEEQVIWEGYFSFPHWWRLRFHPSVLETFRLHPADWIEVKVMVECLI